jgi:peptidoglycan hydrolase CwlO-like protein
VRERELENRLELVRAEKVALLRAKDENILELKKKMEHLQSELENYKEKCSELNKAMGENQDSLKRTARALRLALASLGITEEEILGLKKAE